MFAGKETIFLLLFFFLVLGTRATQETYRPIHQNFHSGQDGKNQEELIQQATSTLQSSYNDNHQQQSVDMDEARYNLATRIMSNGVEVIIASDKTKTVDHLLHGMSSHQLHHKSNYKPMTLAASTIKNQMMILLLPSPSTMDSLKENQTQQFSMYVPFYTNHFITKTCLTTYTYRTTYVQDGQTTVESREKVVSNIATEERNYPKITPSQTMDVTLTRTPELAVGVFPTTYLYYNTFKDTSNNLQVMTSEHIVINTITGPDDYIAYLEPSAKATPVLETNTYYNKITLTSISKDLAAINNNNNNNKMHTVEEVLTQVVVTKSLPPARITSVLTSYYTFDDVNEGDKDNIAQFTLQNLNVENEEDSKDKIIENTKDLENIHIYATKKMLTTLTYYTTNHDQKQQSSSENDVNPTSTLYNLHTRVIENVITDSVPFTLLPTNLLTKVKLELRKHQRRVIVATATLKGGQTLKITAMKMYNPIVRTQAMPPHLKESTLPATTMQQNMETLHETSILGNSESDEEPTEDEHELSANNNYVYAEDDYSSSSSSLSPLSLESYDDGNEDLKQQQQDLQGNEEQNTLDALSSEHVASIVEAPTKNLTLPLKDLVPVKRPTLAANQLIQRLSALRPMFSAMAGLWQNNFGVGGLPEESTVTPIKHVESKYAPNKKIMSNLTLGVSTQHPIYIPVQKPSTSNSKSQFQYHLENPTDHVPQSLHIQPPQVSEMTLESLGKNMWLMSPQPPGHKSASVNNIHSAALSAPKKEQPLHNGGIYIRPGEVITANSDVIVGKPNGIEYVQTPQQNKINYTNATTVNILDNGQYQVTYYQHNVLHPYKQTFSAPALSTLSSQHTRPQHIPIGGAGDGTLFENRESQQYDLRPPLKPSNTENFNRNILKPPPLPYAPPASPSTQSAHNIALPTSIQKLTNAPVPARAAQLYSGGTLPNLYHFNNNLKNNEILEIKRIPEVFSTNLKTTSISHHIQPQPQNTDFGQYNTYVTNFFPERKATQIPIKIKNTPQLSYNWDSSSMVESANLDDSFLKNLSLLKGNLGHSPPKTTQKLGFRDLTKFSSLAMTNATENAKIIDSTSSSPNPLTKNRQRISLQQNVFSHTVDVNVPPLTFNREDQDYPPQATNVRGQIPTVNSIAMKTSDEHHKYMPLIKIPANEQQVQVNLTPLNVIGTIQAAIDGTNPPISYKQGELYDENSFHKVLTHHGAQDQKTVATNNIVVMPPENELQKKRNYPQNLKHQLSSSAATHRNKHLNIPHQVSGEGGFQRQGSNAKEIQQPLKSLTEVNKGWLKVNSSIQKTLQTLHDLESKGHSGISNDRNRTPESTIKTSTDSWLHTHGYDLAKTSSYPPGDNLKLSFQPNKNVQPEEYRNTNVNLQEYFQAGMKQSDHKATSQLTDTNNTLKATHFNEAQKQDRHQNRKQPTDLSTNNSPHNRPKEHQSHQNPPASHSQYEGKLRNNRPNIDETFYEKPSVKPEIIATAETEILAEDINEIIATNEKSLLRSDANSSSKFAGKQTINQGQPFRRPSNNYTSKANDLVQTSNLHLSTGEGFKLVVLEPPNQKIFRSPTSSSPSYPTTEREILQSFETKHAKQSSIHKHINSNKLPASSTDIPESTVRPLALNIQPPPLMKAASTETVVGMNPPPLPAPTTHEIHSTQQPLMSESKKSYETRKRRPIQYPKDLLSSSAQLAKQPESYQKQPTTLQRPYNKINRKTSQRPLLETTSISTSAPKSLKTEKLPANKTSPTYDPIKETFTYLIHNSDHLANEKLVYHIEPSIIDDLTTTIMATSSSPSALTPLLTITTTTTTTTTTLKRIVLPTKYVTNKHVYTVTTTATTTETPSLPYKPLPTSILPTTATETETTTSTLLLTQTKITTVVDTVTSVKTEILMSSAIFATTKLLAPQLPVIQVSTTTSLQSENSKSISSQPHLPYPTVEIVSANITKNYDQPPQAQEESSTPHHHHQLAINPDENSIFIVMTNNNKKNSGSKSSVTDSSTQFVNIPIVLDDTNGGGEMIDKSNEVVIDYDDTISFDAAIPTRDEEPLQNINGKSVSNGKNGIGEVDEGTKTGDHILLGGVLIATPPRVPNNHIVYMTLNGSSSTDSCRPSCKSARNEICVLQDNYWKCTCRPGFARMFPDRPCKPTYTYSLLMHVERIGNYPLVYVQELSDNTTDHYKQLTQLLHNALDRMIMQSDFRDAFHGVQLTQVLDDHKSHQGIIAKFLLQLSDNSDERRLEDVFKKHLRLSNFSIGGTDLYTNKAGADALTINDFNECLSMKFHDCSKDAHCFNLQGTYTCSCREGFADLSENTIYPGRLCSSEQIGCEKCHYHGKCSSASSGTSSNTLDRTFCECFPWYAGATCQVNLKILLIVLLGIGTLLFILLLFCILITCTKRRKNQHAQLATSTMTSTSVSGSGGIGSRFTTNLLITSTGGSVQNGRETVNKRQKSIKIDKRAMIKDSSSESSQSSQNSVPYVLKNRELLNYTNHTKKSPHQNYSKKYINYRAHISASDKYSQVSNNPHLVSQNEFNSLIQPSSTLTAINHHQNEHSGQNAAETEGHYCEQSDRSLTVMIPRAKYHSTVLPQTQLMHHQLTLERTYNSNKLNSDNNMMIRSDKNSDDKQNQKTVTTFTGSDLHSQVPTNLGALISAGFEVSAIVSDHTNVMSSLEQQQNHDLECSEQLTPERCSTSTSDPAISIGTHRQCQNLNQINDRQRFKSTNKTEANNFETESDYNIYNCEKESAEARSFDETTVRASTKPLLICIDENQTQQVNDEANTMAERDVGSTFLLPHTHLYKPERQESEISGFDSF